MLKDLRIDLWQLVLCAVDMLLTISLTSAVCSRDYSRAGEIDLLRDTVYCVGPFVGPSVVRLNAEQCYVS